MNEDELITKEAQLAARLARVTELETQVLRKARERPSAAAD